MLTCRKEVATRRDKVVIRLKDICTHFKRLKSIEKKDLRIWNNFRCLHFGTTNQTAFKVYRLIVDCYFSSVNFKLRQENAIFHLSIFWKSFRMNDIDKKNAAFLKERRHFYQFEKCNYWKDAPTISSNSDVIAAWRVLLYISVKSLSKSSALSVATYIAITRAACSPAKLSNSEV